MAAALTLAAAVFAGVAFDRLRQKMDPRRVNGGVFLGLQGIVIKSHGGTDAEGFAAAIEIGYSMARNGLLEKINQDLAVHREARAEVVACRGTGEPACILRIARTDGKSSQSEAA